MTSEESKIKQEVVEFYNGLLTIDQRNNPKARDKILQGIPKLITNQHNKVLQKHLTKEEVKEIIFIMDPDKALGTYGFPTGFYQKNWDIMGKDVLHVVKEFFKKAKLLK